MYDIFFIGNSDHPQFKKLKQKVFSVKHAADLKAAKLKSLTKFLWIVYPEIEIEDNFTFDYTIDQWSENYTHVWLNGDRYDGLALMPKSSHHGKGEIEARFFINKKEVPVIASCPVKEQYDIVFISYQEPDADENYKSLTDRFPNAKRIHGVKGIHQAHIEAAKLCSTELIWIVDGDAHIADAFNFDYIPKWWNRDAVHVWRSENPINGLHYGYGGVKLFPREKTLNMDTSKPDMTTSISNKFVAMEQVSNITGFNTDPFNTWKSAFRECCKLSSKVIDRQKDNETNNRLSVWCNESLDNALFKEHAIAGAKAGAMYGARNSSNLEALKMINDFDWLKEQFDGNL